MTGEAVGQFAEIDALAERLYEWSGGIFWCCETAWQDRHREEASQWFAYAALLERVTRAEGMHAEAFAIGVCEQRRIRAVEALEARYYRHGSTENWTVSADIRAVLDPTTSPGPTP